MFICICHGISKSKICFLISQGALTLAAIQRQCGAGTNCGTCVNKLVALLDSEAKSPAPQRHRRQKNVDEKNQAP